MRDTVGPSGRQAAGLHNKAIGLPDQATSLPDQASRRVRARAQARGRTLWLLIALTVAFTALAGQLVRLGLRHVSDDAAPRIALNAHVSRTFARPDIVDRTGRLLATDLVGHSLFADPSVILDPDRAVEALLVLFPDIDPGALRKKLSNPASHFEWIKRGLTPRIAQQAHDLGIPGLGLRKEPKRTYPLGRLAGHILGVVSTDNKGLSGIERYVDQEVGIETAVSGEAGSRRRLRLTIDVGVQHGLEEELAAAIERYRARAAAGVIIDVTNGEIAGMASLPDVDPAFVMESQELDRLDRMTVGRYELGSVFKAVTLAMALEDGHMRLDQAIDVEGPLLVGGHKISDLHPAGRLVPLGTAFLKSSNVGFGRIGLALGHQRLQSFFERLGLSTAMHTEAGPLATMRLPQRWREAETATAAFGHGIAVTPMQFAAAAAALVNGGRRIRPTLIAPTSNTRPQAPEAALTEIQSTPANSGHTSSDHTSSTETSGGRANTVQVISTATSDRLRALLRANVAGPVGTGKRADAKGYEVGGKTGTAEQPVAGQYKEKSVISSFLGAFPMSNPRYLTYVVLFEPQPTEETHGHITAGYNAAPLTARLVHRVAPLLGIAPRTN